MGALRGRQWLSWTDHHGRPFRDLWDRTPLDLGWQRKVYERVVSPIWPMLTEGIEPVRADGRLPADAVLSRLAAAVEALADGTPWQDQETWLEVQPMAKEIPPIDCVGPIKRRCACAYCRQAAKEQREERKAPRVQRVRQAFVENLAYHVETVLETPNAYDRKHGTPRLFWGRLTSSKGASHAA